MTINRAYRSHQVSGAGQLDLLLLTYDALIQNLNHAKNAVMIRDYAAQAEDSMRATEALFELMKSLDYEQGGELALSLGSLYSYMYRRLMEAQSKDTLDSLAEIMSLAETLREGWQGLADQEQEMMAPQKQFAGAVG